MDFNVRWDYMDLERVGVCVTRVRGSGEPLLHYAFGTRFKSGKFIVSKKGVPRTDEILRAVALYLKFKIDYINRWKKNTDPFKHYCGLEFQDGGIAGYRLYFVEPGYDVKISIGSGVEQRLLRQKHEEQLALEREKENENVD